MINLQRHIETWAEECRTGELRRRDFLSRVLVIGGSVPMAVALLQTAGVSADAEEIAEVRAESAGAEDLLEDSASKSADDDASQLLRCSFCDKDQNEVRKLIAGPSVFICDECVEVCNDIIADDNKFEARRASRRSSQALKRGVR